MVLLVFGVRNVFMATGNDTLVKSSTDVYQDNLMLEEEFGGESIIVLYESDHLLTPKNLAHMKGLEDTLQTSDSIYSILSPITLVEEIANKQSDNFKGGIEEIIDGLDTMGTKLIEIGKEMEENTRMDQGLDFPEQTGLEMPDLGGVQLPEFEGIKLPELEDPEIPEFGETQLPDIDGQLAELNNGFAQLIDAQENLADGTQNLVNGYVQFGRKTEELAKTLGVIANQVEDNQQQSQQLLEISGGLKQLSEQMVGISENTAQLPGVSTQTINGLQNMQEKLNKQLNEQKQQQEHIQQEQKKMQEDMKKKLQLEQSVKEEQIKKEMERQLVKQKTLQDEMEKQQEQKQKKIKDQMLNQQKEKEKQMQEFKENMQGKMDKQAENLNELAEGLTEMGEKLQTISENMETIHGYSDIMKPSLPTKQETLDNIVYDDSKLRPIFEEVIIDDKYMLMMIRFDGATTDNEKSEVVQTINDYLDSEMLEAVETLVSGKPVLDNAIRSSMLENIQKMMGLALLIMVIVLFFVFKVQWRILPLLVVLIAVVGTVGLMGWLQIPITMVSMAVFPILIGLGIDYAIQFQNRYDEEMHEEDSNE